MNFLVTKAPKLFLWSVQRISLAFKGLQTNVVIVHKKWSHSVHLIISGVSLQESNKLKSHYYINFSQSKPLSNKKRNYKTRVIIRNVIAQYNQNSVSFMAGISLKFKIFYIHTRSFYWNFQSSWYLSYSFLVVSMSASPGAADNIRFKTPYL